MSILTGMGVCLGVLIAFLLGRKSGRRGRDLDLLLAADPLWRRSIEVWGGRYYVVPEDEYRDKHRAGAGQ